MNLEKNPKTRPIAKRLLALEDRVSGLAFPKMLRAKQITNSHCGPAVLTSLFSILGVKSSQSGIVASLRAKKKIMRYGLNMKELARASKMVGKGAFSFWRKSNAKISDLKLIVNKYKYPVAVEWQGVFYEDEDDDNGHYCIITKIDKEKGTLRLSDPYSHFAGVDRKFDIKFFATRWWDENMIKGRVIQDKRVMFLIAPKDEIWPKKLGMIRA